MSLRDLVSGPNCGTGNAISGLANVTSDIQAQIQEAHAYQQAPGGPMIDMMHRNDMVQGMMMPNGPGMQVGNSFLNAFDHGPSKIHMPPPMHGPMHIPPPQMHMPMGPTGEDFVAEFEKMHLHPQQEEFEKIYAEQHMSRPPPPHLMHGPPPPNAMFHQHLGGPAQWSEEFAQQQQHAHEQQEMENVYNQVARGPESWAYEFNQMNEFMKNKEQNPSVQIRSEEDVLEEAYEEATNETVKDWVNEFSGDTTTSSQAPMGMGLDANMIEQLKNHPNPKFRNSKFLNFVEKISKGEIEFRDNGVVEKSAPQIGQDWASEFSKPVESESWADQFNQQHFPPPTLPQETVQHEPVDGDIDTEQWVNEYNNDSTNWISEYESMNQQFQSAMEQATLPDPSYEFSANNPFATHPDPFGLGQRLLKEGELKEAILALEAACQKNPQDAEAWRFLGQAQAENEDERAAIAALLKAIALDPYNLEALLMLGVSYTNDLEEHRALNYLKTWLLHNPDYQDPTVNDAKRNVTEYEQFYGGTGMGSAFDGTLHSEVTKMFIDAVRINPNDPELHTVLGVLYHISNDFEKSLEAFATALKLKPNDPYLWNKLGATQANSSRSEEAVFAYQKALALKPNYVRAAANMAIAFANQGLHEQAAAQYLRALRLNPNAEHIWSYLRISLSHMGRDSLVELSMRKNVDAFKPYFEF